MKKVCGNDASSVPGEGHEEAVWNCSHCDVWLCRKCLREGVQVFASAEEAARCPGCGELTVYAKDMEEERPPPLHIVVPCEQCCVPPGDRYGRGDSFMSAGDAYPLFEINVLYGTIKSVTGSCEKCESTRTISFSGGGQKYISDEVPDQVGLDREEKKRLKGLRVQLGRMNKFSRSNWLVKLLYYFFERKNPVLDLTPGRKNGEGIVAHRIRVGSFDFVDDEPKEKELDETKTNS